MVAILFRRAGADLPAEPRHHRPGSAQLPPSQKRPHGQQNPGRLQSGVRDSAAFWMELGGKFIYIRYFPVRDANGRYRGTLEVSQDLTEIRKLEGDNRLLDWE